MFLHRHIAHLLANVATILLLGTILEHDLGAIKFTVLFLIPGIGGIALSALCSNAVGVGSSPAIYGLVGCYVSCLILNWLFLKQNQTRRW